MQFIKSIQNFAFQNNLWSAGAKIVVGVSGGPDSTCLLSVLTKLESKYDFKLHIAHVNYNLRGKESEQDEIFVRKLAEKHGIEITVLSVKKTPNKGNLENNLREIRYAFFEKLRAELKFDLIAVAHNQDEQAETVLMRILRGSGLSGLGAMKAKNGNIIRPFLQVSKAEILEYLKENKLEFRTDESNFDVKFTRNNIRHNLLPYLEKNYNPAIKKTLSFWAQNVAEDYNFINESAQNFFSQAYNNKSAHFDEQNFLRLHPSIQRQVLRNIFQKISVNSNDAESRQIEEMLKIIKSKKNKSQKALIGGLNIIKKGDKIEISKLN